MAFLSSAVAVPSLVLGTLLEAGELPDFGALPLAPAPSPANSAALARSGNAALLHKVSCPITRPGERVCMLHHNCTASFYFSMCNTMRCSMASFVQLAGQPASRCITLYNQQPSQHASWGLNWPFGDQAWRRRVRR